MDKKLAGLLGAAATLTAVGTVQADAAPTVELAPAATYGELLDPISNALALLKTDDARLAGTSTGGRMRLAQDHHHHHHHHIGRRLTTITTTIARRTTTTTTTTTTITTTITMAVDG